MRIKIIIKVIDEFLKKKEEKLTQEEIKLYLEMFDKAINTELYLHDPTYHYIAKCQRNALLVGCKDWFMYGKIP
jgi:Ca2+-binding EF-hand superfamily protein